MEMISELRMGYAMGILTIPRPSKSLYQIMMEIQPGHLLRMSPEELDESAQDEYRASYLRGVFGRENLGG